MFYYDKLYLIEFIFLFMNKILAIDYGTTKAGLALSDELNLMAWPLDIIYYKNEDDLVNRVEQIIRDKEIGQVVIGLPIESQGRERELINQIKDFGKVLNKKLDVQIDYENEVFTSSIAKEQLGSLNSNKRKNNDDIDDEAAANILQSYLDRKHVKHFLS